jgi:hypothetical protein
VRQTWDEQRPNHGAILAYLAREEGGSDGRRPSTSGGESPMRFCAWLLFVAFGIFVVWVSL